MNSKGKTLHVRDEGLVRQWQDFLGFVMAATVFGLQFPFTGEVLLFLLLEVSCAGANFTQLGLYSIVIGASPFCLPVASMDYSFKHFNFWPVVDYTLWKDAVCVVSPVPQGFQGKRLECLIMD